MEWMHNRVLFTILIFTKSGIQLWGQRWSFLHIVHADTSRRQGLALCEKREAASFRFFGVGSRGVGIGALYNDGAKVYSEFYLILERRVYI